MSQPCGASSILLDLGYLVTAFDPPDDLTPWHMRRTSVPL